MQKKLKIVLLQLNLSFAEIIRGKETFKKNPNGKTFGKKVKKNIRQFHTETQ